MHENRKLGIYEKVSMMKGGKTDGHEHHSGQRDQNADSKRIE